MLIVKYLLTLVIFIITLNGCNNFDTNTKTTTTVSTIDTTKYRSGFEQNLNGKETKLYILQNKNIKVAVTNYGGRLVSLWVPSKNGNITDVVEGFANLQQYLKSTAPYFGATIGRYGNRIAKGKFKIEGIEYTSSINNPPNMLHGGKNGFQSKVFDAKQIGDTALELTYLSKDGEEGFPGKVSYAVEADAEALHSIGGYCLYNNLSER